MNGFYYKRVLLKISGESLMGKQTYGIDTDMVLRVAEEVKGVSEQGIEVCLVIGAGDARIGDARFVDIKELSSYYTTNVIRGPGAFVEVALGYEAFAAAMERKMIRELASMAVGAAE